MNFQVSMAPLVRTVRETEDVAGMAMVKAAMVLKRLAIISTMPTLICGRLKDGESHADWRRIRASSCSRKSRPFQKNCLVGEGGVDDPGPDEASAMDKLENLVGG